MATVLIVEHDATTREALAHNLELEGRSVLTAADGAARLGLARELHSDERGDSLHPAAMGLAQPRADR
jgi:DNA-binding response OmpR family regulator